MGIGLGIVLLAIGAVLTFAVDATVSGLSIDAVGVILMIAGAVALVLGMVAYGRTRDTTTHVVRDDTLRR